MMRTVLSLGVASLLLAGLPAHATNIAIEADNGVLDEQAVAGEAITYTRPDNQGGPVLLARTQRPVLCAGLPGSAGGPQSKVVIDSNGYLPAFSISGLRMSSPGGEVTYASGAMFRTGELLSYGGASYEHDGNNLVLNIVDVAANCWEGLASVSPGPAVASCSTVPNASSDRIRRGDFENIVEGTPVLSSRVIDEVGDVVFYEHQITAMDGPVYGIQLREQFPYHMDSGVPRYRKSLEIDSGWECRASEGAHCGGRRVQAERGYALLDNASLDQAGACLRIVSIRDKRIDGGIANDFSGSIHAVVTSSGANGPKVAQTRIQFAN